MGFNVIKKEIGIPFTKEEENVEVDDSDLVVQILKRFRSFLDTLYMVVYHIATRKYYQNICINTSDFGGGPKKVSLQPVSKNVLNALRKRLLSM